MRRRRSIMKKERIIMLASSVFVLAALTMTGFYVREKNQEEKDGYMVDMSALEKQTKEKTDQIAASLEEEEKVADKGAAVPDSDLDYDPNFQEASSPSVENGWQAPARSVEPTAGQEEIPGPDQAPVSSQRQEPTATQSDESSEEGDEKSAVEASSTDVRNALSFRERDNLAWPVAGNVLINYSMDKTVYFPTLQQYRHSPAIVIAAKEGENIVAAADGRVVSVFEDAKIGHGVKVDIGNGYELTYGQLQDIMVMKDDVVSTGDVLGTVAAPTKYYSVEGPNVYFAVEKDGVPVNPLEKME